jgi:tetratricopeptide (TPR) repeat protein
VALARAARLEEAVEYVERSIGVAQEYELPQAACRAYTNLGVLYTNLDPGQAIEICTAGLELAKKIGDLSLQSWLYANLAGAYCTFTGQCEAEGIAAAEAAIELDRQLGQLDHLAVPLVVLGQIYQCHGDLEAALASYQEALRLAQEMREPQLLFPCYDGLATLYLESGDVTRAEEYLAKGEQVCQEAGLEVDSLVMMPFLY